MQKLFSLVKHDLIKANSQNISTRRQNLAKGQQDKAVSIMPTIFLTSGIVMFAMFLVFGVFMFQTPMYGFPTNFSMVLSLSAIMIVSIAMQQIYALFYETNDSAFLLSMPYTKGEIAWSKTISFVIGLLPYLIPIIVVMVIAGLQSPVSNMLTVPVAILASVTFVMDIFFIAILFSHFITTVFGKYVKPKVLFGIIYAVTFILMMGFYLYNSFKSGQMTEQMTNLDPNADYTAMLRVDFPEIFTGLYNIITNPLSINSWISFLPFALVLIIGFIVYIKWFIPNSFKENTFETNPNANVRSKTYGSLNKILTKYNRTLISDPIIFMNTAMSSVFMPLIMGMSVIPIRSEVPNIDLHISMIGMFIAIGGAFAFGMNIASLPSFIVSLDKDNFNYAKALPFTFKSYLKNKLNFSRIIAVYIPALIIAIILFFMNFGIVYILAAMAGYIPIALIVSEKDLVWDYNHLDLNWTSINDLIRRENQFILVLKVFGKMILMVLIGVAIALVFTFANNTVRWILTAIIILIMIGIHFFFRAYYDRKLWNKLD